MPLAAIEPRIIDSSALPSSVASLLGEAELRIDKYQREQGHRTGGFVPCQFATVYRALRAISEAGLAPGNVFCEWGSGFGVVAMLAAMVGFEALGVEIEWPLVEASRQLADDFGIAVEFVCGSFIPRCCAGIAEAAFAASNPEYFWLTTDVDETYETLGLDPRDFDVVFAYPWPGETSLIDAVFEKHGAPGALLLTFDSFDRIELRRNVSRTKR